MIVMGTKDYAELKARGIINGDHNTARISGLPVSVRDDVEVLMRTAERYRFARKRSAAAYNPLDGRRRENR